MELSDKALAKNKLTILFLLDKLDIRLSENQLVTLMSELSLMTYFDYKLNITGLLDSALVDVKENISGTYYSINDTGRETLQFFYKEIPFSVRERLTAFAERERDRLELEGRLYAEYLRLSDNEYKITMRIMQGDFSSFELSLVASTKEECALIAEGFKRNAQALYEKTYEMLFKK